MSKGLPTAILRHRDASLIIRQDVLAGTSLAARLKKAPRDEAGFVGPVLTLDDTACDSLEQLKAFISVCEHRWGVLRAPLATLEVVALGVQAMPLLRAFEATAVLQAVREAVQKAPADVLAHLRECASRTVLKGGIAGGVTSKQSVASYSEPFAETRGSGDDAKPTGRWFGDVRATRQGHSEPTVRRCVHESMPTPQQSRDACALALLRAWVAEDEAAGSGSVLGLVDSSTCTSEVLEYERLLGRAAMLRAEGKLEEEAKLLEMLGSMREGGWVEGAIIGPGAVNGAGASGGTAKGGGAQRAALRVPSGQSNPTPNKPVDTASKAAAFVTDTERMGAAAFRASNLDFRYVSMPLAKALAREKLAELPQAKSAKPPAAWMGREATVAPADAYAPPTSAVPSNGATRRPGQPSSKALADARIKADENRNGATRPQRPSTDRTSSHGPSGRRAGGVGATGITGATGTHGQRGANPPSTQGDFLNVAKARRQAGRPNAAVLLEGQGPPSSLTPGLSASPPAQAVDKAPAKPDTPAAAPAAATPKSSARRNGTKGGGSSRGGGKVNSARRRPPGSATPNDAVAAHTGVLLDHSAGLVRDYARTVHAPHAPHAPHAVMPAVEATMSEHASAEAAEALEAYQGTAFRSLSEAASARGGAQAELYIDAARRGINDVSPPKPTVPVLFDRTPPGPVVASPGGEALRQRIAARGF